MKQIFIAILFLMLSGASIAQEESLKDTQKLAEVTVRGQRPLFQQRPDGVVVNVQGSILAKGNSLMQVLQQSPGVVIDHRNNSIMMNGKNGVSVMLDGRLLRMPPEQVMAMINNMSANNIASIELLTTPGAKYDAEGNAGIINIITRKNRSEGTSGNVLITAGQGWGPKGVITAGVTHNIKKISVNGSYTHNRDRTYSDLDIFSTQNMPVLGGLLNTTYRDTTRRSTVTHEFSGGVDFRPDAATTLGASVLFNHSYSKVNTHTVADYDVSKDSIFFDGDIRRRNRWTNLVSSVYLNKKLKRNDVLNIGLDYLYFDNSQPSQVYNDFYNKSGQQPIDNDTLFSPLQRGASNTIINGGVFKLDYNRRLNKKVQLESGIKANYTKAESGSSMQSQVNGEWINRDEANTNIRMAEQIIAGYTSLNLKLNTSLSVVVGTRYEYSTMNIRYPASDEAPLKRKKGIFFPALSINKQVANAEWQFSYSKRISRPSFNDLASYASYSDPTAVYTGNPLLLPAVSHSLKIGYVRSGYSLALLAGRDLNNIARYQLTESASRRLLHILPVNIPRQENIQLQLTAPVTVNSWWKMNNSVTSGWRKFRLEHTAAVKEKSYLFYTASTNQMFLLSRGYSFEFSGWYNSLMYNGSVQMKGFGAVNAGVKKELKNGGGTLQLGITDIFRTTRINSYYGAVAREAFDIKNQVAYNTETTRSPVFRLTYSRSFGRGEGSSKRSAIGGEENQRIRKD